MKRILLLTLSILLLFNSNSFAAKNAVRLSAEFPRFISYEYERKVLVPGLRAFINYGSADVTIDDDETSQPTLMVPVHQARLQSLAKAISSWPEPETVRRMKK